MLFISILMRHLVRAKQGTGLYWRRQLHAAFELQSLGLHFRELIVAVSVIRQALVMIAPADICLKTCKLSSRIIPPQLMVTLDTQYQFRKLSSDSHTLRSITEAAHKLTSSN